MEQVHDNPRGGGGEQRAGDDADGGLAGGGEGCDFSGAGCVSGAERLRDKPGGGAAEPQVEQAEVADDGPHQGEQPEPAVAERPRQNGDADEPDDEGDGLAEDAEEGVAGETVQLGDQTAPLRRNTAGIVWSRIFRSRSTDHSRT